MLMALSQQWTYFLVNRLSSRILSSQIAGGGRFRLQESPNNMQAMVDQMGNQVVIQQDSVNNLLTINFYAFNSMLVQQYNFSFYSQSFMYRIQRADTRGMLQTVSYVENEPLGNDERQIENDLVNQFIDPMVQYYVTMASQIYQEMQSNHSQSNHNRW